MIDWSTCPEIERDPGRVGGAWTFRGTRLPVSALFDNLAAGATVPEFLEWFQGVTPERVDAVLAHVSRSADADGPVPIGDELAAELRRPLERYRADPDGSSSPEEVRRAGHEAARRTGEPSGTGRHERPRDVRERDASSDVRMIGTVETLPFDPAVSLDTRDAAAACLEAALEDGDGAVIVAALAHAVRSKGLATALLDAGATDEAMRESLTPAGDPGLATLLAVTKALGLELRVRPTSDDASPPDAPSPSDKGGPARDASGPVISRDPEVLGGTPAFARTRVPIKALFDYLETGDTIANFLDDFPGVSHGQVTRVLEEARGTLIGPDEPVARRDEDPSIEAARRDDPKSRPRKVRYGGRELEAIPANGVTGLLPSSFDRTWTFRVTHEDGTFSDYRLRHDDMKITIADDELAAFYTDGGETGILDHSPEVLGLIPGAPRTVFCTDHRPSPDGRDVGREILDGVREIKAFDRGEGPALRTRHLRKIDAPEDDQSDDGPDGSPNS